MNFPNLVGLIDVVLGVIIYKYVHNVLYSLLLIALSLAGSGIAVVVYFRNIKRKSGCYPWEQDNASK
ncbi:MAG: hypothetical protein PHE88_11910 [Elusimicrobia bacterium]|nr:hypothetical protein [Elusimicrobiota bacterium]